VVANKNNNSDRPDPLIGKRLGDYTIQGLIGRGGMARVYEGYDEKLGRRAAIKVMEVYHEHGDEMTQRFIREARAVATLDHPGIISVYQFGEGQDLYYMAMKYVEGRTLLSILKQLRQQQQFLEPQYVSAIVADVSAALDYAHSRGVIHRDIKPSNIMLTSDNRAVLTDFGLTMQLGSDSTLGTAFGTPRYIAPEQAMSSQKSVPQSDIYSLGVVLYEMATGRAPFDDESPMSLALSHITNAPPTPQSVRADLPHPVQMVILKALEKRPENRWQTGTEMAEALRVAYDGVEPDVVLSQDRLELPILPIAIGSAAVPAVTVDTDRTPVPRRLPQPRRLPVRTRPIPWRLLGVVALIALALVGLGLYNLMPRGGLIGGAVALQPPAPPSRVRLIYSKDTFAIYNPTGQSISLEGIVFMRNDAAGRPYEASRFGDRIHKALPTGQCLRLRMNNVDDQAFPLICGPQTKPQIYDDRNIVFWTMRDDKDTTDSFLVKRGERILQICSMRLNTCEFSLS
jgi:serine/threonine protein kinase